MLLRRPRSPPGTAVREPQIVDSRHGGQRDTATEHPTISFRNQFMPECQNLVGKALPRRPRSLPGTAVRDPHIADCSRGERTETPPLTDTGDSKKTACDRLNLIPNLREDGPKQRTAMYRHPSRCMSTHFGALRFTSCQGGAWKTLTGKR